LVRERHLAKALRIAVEARYPSVPQRMEFLRTLYGGREPKADPSNLAATENEIRNNLLKAGGAAFVEEDEKAFLEVSNVIDIISNAGGIPCYPVLLDDAKGNLTDFESDPEALFNSLTAKGVFCIELIPGRNDISILEPFVRYFREKGFIILFGTEHNTPEMAPLTISCRNRVPLSPELRETGIAGACILAAHQYYRAKGMQSPVMAWSGLNPVEKREILELGIRVIDHYKNS
jgi:hypothetical protein